MYDFNSSVRVSMITVVTRECQISCSIRTAWWGSGNFAEGSKGERKTNAVRPPGGGRFSKSCSKGTCYTFDSSWTSEDISSALVHLVRGCSVPHAFGGCLYYISSSVTILTTVSSVLSDCVTVWNAHFFFVLIQNCYERKFKCINSKNCVSHKCERTLEAWWGVTTE
jgi:hypothetical protein